MFLATCNIASWREGSDEKELTQHITYLIVSYNLLSHCVLLLAVSLIVGPAVKAKQTTLYNTLYV